jgi:hypothetical protein
MADYLMQVGMLNAKKNSLSEQKGKTELIIEKYEGSLIKAAPSAISKVAAKVANNMKRLKNGYTNSDSWFTGYLSELEALEAGLAGFSNSNLKEPIVFNGVFEDIFGKVTMPAIKTGGDKNCNEFLGRIGSDHMIKIELNGKEFWVVDTKISVQDYANYVYSHGLNQNAGLLGGDCMLLSQYYAVDMLRGTYTSKGTMAATQGSPATRINNPCLSQNEQDVLNFAYNEINEGRPVVLQVTQIRSNEGLRHLVTMVGFTSDVKSAADLNPDNILVLDCVDGKLQTLGQAREQGGHARSLFNQGRKGYYALGATDKFLAKEVTGVAT